METDHDAMHEEVSEQCKIRFRRISHHPTTKGLAAEFATLEAACFGWSDRQHTVWKMKQYSAYVANGPTVQTPWIAAVMAGSSHMKGFRLPTLFKGIVSYYTRMYGFDADMINCPQIVDVFVLNSRAVSAHLQA